MPEKIRRGDLVEVVTTKKGGNTRRRYVVKRKGRVVALYRRFAVVEFRRGYKECVWSDDDRSNNPVMRRVSN